MAFDGCSGLTEINVDDGNAEYSSLRGVLFDKKRTVLIKYPGGKSGSYTIPGSVTNIGEGAFNCCTGLTGITIPGSVTNIGAMAFDGCSGLSEINVDDGNAEYSSLDGVMFDKNWTTLILYPRGKPGSYTIPDSVTSLGRGAFSGCTSLASVTIPGSVINIGEHAFSGCTGLTSATICSGVTNIEGGAFGGCTGLTSVTIPGSVKRIFSHAFYGCTGLSSVTIPESVTVIGQGVFQGCTKLPAALQSLAPRGGAVPASRSNPGQIPQRQPRPRVVVPSSR